ncbi:MAG: DUF58 domain-containing protein [Chloroflexi bacterium]|nr:DUF58 domain-containing protein [Chloroflexota bacterium]
MLLTRRAFFLFLLNVPLLAGAIIAPALLYLAGVYFFLILGMIFADRVITPAPKEFDLARINDSRLSLGAENLVVIRVTNRSRRAARVIVRDEFPAQFIADQLVLREQKIAPRATGEFRYHIRPPRRGDYRFGDLNLRWRGILGLIVRQARFPAGAPVKVYPNLLDIRKYELLVRKGQLAEMGLRQTRWLGSGTQFERLREYQFDDEFRRIDWKATARRGKPITREFETERSQNIIALLDVGRLMRAPVGGPSASSGHSLEKVDYAVNAALMLSYVAGLRGDKVGLLAFADNVTHYLPPKAGKGQFYRMLATLYAIESQPVEADYTRAFAYLRAKHKKRSLIILFTDLASGLAAKTLVAQIAPLWPRHLPLLVALNDPAVVAIARVMPNDSPSVYERMVAEQLLDERAVTLESLRRRGILTLDVPANQLTIAVVNKYLELKARGKL